MVVSYKLALEIYTIELFHLLASILAFTYLVYFWFKAKRSPLLYSFTCLIGMLIVWMVSKIFKTVSPNESIRWFFIVIQYFGIEFSGYFLVIFALLYTRDKPIRKKTLVLLAIPPLLSFLIVLTNPYHMKFYSYFDFYKDNFGVLFFPTQFILYAYLITGVIMLSLGFTKQPQFKNRKRTARFFALAIITPIVFNIYYLLVKLTDVPWIINIPFFDFTPITSTLSLILFIIPAFRYRFLDIMPFACRHIFNQLSDALVFISKGDISTVSNQKFEELACNSVDFENIKSRVECLKETSEIVLSNQKTYMLTMSPIRRKQQLLSLKDITHQIRLKNELHNMNAELQATNTRLKKMLEMAGQLAAAKTKARVAQDVHDIFGHTLIVVIGLVDLAQQDPSNNSLLKLSQAKELLNSGVLDLRIALAGQTEKYIKTTLEKSILSLCNQTIETDFSVKGKAVELNSLITDAIYRICQEAMTNSIKHGKAAKITIILRFKTNLVELYIIDNGLGCKQIKKGYGFIGIERRAQSVNGSLSYGSDGEKGFYIHLTIPV